MNHVTGISKEKVIELEAERDRLLVENAELLEALREECEIWRSLSVSLRNVEAKSLEREVALVAALERMLQVQDALMPGIRHISVPDYALINDAPMEARAAIAKAKGAAS